MLNQVKKILKHRVSNIISTIAWNLIRQIRDLVEESDLVENMFDAFDRYVRNEKKANIILEKYHLMENMMSLIDNPNRKC